MKVTGKPVRELQCSDMIKVGIQEITGERKLEQG